MNTQLFPAPVKKVKQKTGPKPKFKDLDDPNRHKSQTVSITDNDKLRVEAVYGSLTKAMKALIDALPAPKK